MNGMATPPPEHNGKTRSDKGGKPAREKIGGVLRWPAEVGLRENTGRVLYERVPGGDLNVAGRP